jgi:hypothetical protein
MSCNTSNDNKIVSEFLNTKLLQIFIIWNNSAQYIIVRSIRLIPDEKLIRSHGVRTIH